MEGGGGGEVGFMEAGGWGYTIHTNPGLRLGLGSLNIMPPLTPTPPTSHLPNNTAYE